MEENVPVLVNVDNDNEIHIHEKSTARHALRGLAIVSPPCIHQHNAREAERRAHHDAFGADRGAPGRNPTDDRGKPAGASARPRGGDVRVSVLYV